MNNFGIRVGGRVRIGILPLLMSGLVLSAILAWVLGGYYNYDIHALISYYSNEPPRYVVNVVVGDRYFGVHTFGDYLLTHDYARAGNPWINTISVSNNYPPVAMGLFWVFSFLPYKPGLILFLLLSMGSMLYPVYAELKRKNLFGKYGTLLVPIALSVGFIAALDRGNSVGLLVTPLYLFFRALKEEKWGKSSILLALLIAFKVYPILLVLAYIPRRKFMAATEAILLSLGASFIVATLFQGGYVEKINAIARGILGYRGTMPTEINPSNVSLYSAFTHTLSRFPSLNAEYQFLLSHAWWIGIFYFILILFVVVARVLPDEIAILLLVSTLWLVAPLSLHYATAFLIVPIALSLGTSKKALAKGGSATFDSVYSVATIAILTTLLPIVIPVSSGRENAMRTISSLIWLLLALICTVKSVIGRVRRKENLRVVASS
ncbi:MAG: DUF2029 domain-containing protein [Actinobacteria bacterium]|nr:DUF2029 domain-containing protein [Actinomycetota bacterium]